jgi:hypothetical protein
MRCTARSGLGEQRSLGETEFATEVARISDSGQFGQTRCCAGIIGYVDLRIGGKAKALLEQHIAVSEGRLRGIRNRSTWHADPNINIYGGAPRGLLLDQSFREGFASLASLRLSFDAWIFQTQLV